MLLRARTGGDVLSVLPGDNLRHLSAKAPSTSG
jgi:hypothetical protein